MNERIDRICDDFESAWRQGEKISIETALASASAQDREEVLLELIYLEIGLSKVDGTAVDQGDLERRFPDDKAIIRRAFSDDRFATEVVKLADNEGQDIVDSIAAAFVETLKRGDEATLASFVNQVPETRRGEALQRLLGLEIRFSEDLSKMPDFGGYARQFPEYRETIDRVASEFLNATTDHVPRKKQDFDLHATGDFNPRKKGSDGKNEDADEPPATEDLTPLTPGPQDTDTMPFQRIGKIERDASSSQSQSASRFRIKTTHAKGGLGEVFLAHDTELNRDVALKEIQGTHHEEAEYNYRFLLEAEVTGRLEHPGIVPVYSLGAYADGRPFYAMRFIHGDSFHRAMRDFHKANPTKNVAFFMNPDLHKLLRRFIAVCQAIHYAHERGVLHRDIKPANIMLGEFGETLVVDWGLAKIMELPDEAEPNDDDQPSPGSHLRGRMDSKHAVQTMQGNVVGTPAFMSPEQTDPFHSNIGRGSDIYSLGATLFTIITGENSVKGESFTDLRDKLTNGKVKTLRSVSSSAPKALNAICCKAMAVSPSERYETAVALGEDLDRWMTDQIVEAYRDQETFGERFGRFLRKNKTFAKSLALTLVAITVAAIVASTLINQARVREHAAQVLATKFKGEAIDRYELSRSSIDRLLVSSNESLSRFPATNSIRKELLQQAAEDLAKLSALKSDDPELELERGRALVRLGDVHQMQNKFALARTRYNEAATVFEDARTQGNAEMERRRLTELANTQAREGLSWDFEQEFGKAETSYKAAMDALKPIVEASPNFEKAMRYASTTKANLAELFQRVDRLEEAIEMSQQGMDDLKKLSDLSGKTSDQIALVQARNIFGGALSRSGQHSLAIDAFKVNIAELDSILKRETGNREARLALGQTHIMRAAAAKGLGLWKLELETLQKAGDVYVGLQTEFPDVAIYAENVATTQVNLGMVLLGQGRAAEADALFQLAVGSYQQLMSFYGDSPSFRQGWGIALDGLAQSQLEVTPELADALTCLMQTEQVFGQYFDASDPQNIERLALACSHRGRVLTKLNRIEEAAEQFVRAETLLSSLVTSDPKLASYQTSLAQVHMYHGNAWLLKDEKLAGEKYQRAAELWEKLISKFPDAIDGRLAFCRHLLHCPDKSRRNPVKARGILELLIKRFPESPAVLGLLVFATPNDATDSSNKLLEKLKTQRDGILSDEELCAAARVQHLLGLSDEAKQSLADAKAIMKQRRPESSEIRQLIDETAKLIGDESEPED